MIKVPVYNSKGEKTGDIALNETIFGAKVNTGLVHRALLLQQANARRPIAHTKTRGEIRGGGKKPWRQKGTGRARQGSIRGPHWKGGGVAFGPRSNRNYTLMMPQKERRKALFCALSGKAKEQCVLVLEEDGIKEIKTKPFAEMLKKLPLKRNVLIVIPKKNERIQKSSRNLPQAKTILANYLNVKDLLTHHQVMFLKEALPKLEETFLK